MTDQSPIAQLQGRLPVRRIYSFILAFSVLFVAMHFDADFIQPFLPKIISGNIRVLHEVLFIGFFIFLAMFYNKSYNTYLHHVNNEAQLKLFIRHMPAAVAMLDRDMNYLVASNRWLQDYNIADQDITGKNHYDIFPMIRDNDIWMTDHCRCLKGETIRREDDSFIGLSGKREWLTYEILPWRNLNRAIGGLIFYTEVVTPRMEALQQLQQSEARFERVMRGSNDGIWDWNVVDNTVYFSPRFKQLMGYEDHEVTNTMQGWASLLHPDDVPETMKRVEAHLKDKSPYIVEYRLRKKSSEYIWIEARGEAECGLDGKPLYFSGTMIDITERKRLEGLKNEFVYVVTHELRTPLAALRGALDMLQMLGNDLPIKATKSLDLALQGCERLNLLVNDLLEAGRAEADQLPFVLERASVKELLNYAVELDSIYGEKYGVTYQLSCGVPDCDIMVDKNRFLQIMANLLSNGAKFSPRNSVVNICAQCEDDHVTIAVQDHGAGIPEEFKPRIFQKFARNHSDIDGTGLGLNITKTMVEKMNGKIWFESELGKGTIFYVSFPITI